MSTTEDINSSKVMSALTAITSLAASLLPNAIDLQQINHLISNLIRMPSSDGYMSSTDITSIINGSVIEDQSLQMRREKHRQTERIRHNTIIELIRQLSEMIGIQERHETQANILNRSARYIIFLSHVIEKLEADSNDDTIDVLSEEWLQSLYPLYNRAFEEATKILQSCDEDINSCVSESSQDSSDPLISMAFKK